MKKFCPFVSNNIEIDSAGYYKPCCISTKKFEINGVPANAQQYSLPDIMKLSDRKDWIANFNNDILERDCRQCHDLEKSGGESKRQREERTWSADSQDFHGVFTPNTLQSIDLKMGNTCNLLCAICSPWSSSKWGSFYRSIDMSNAPYQRWPDKTEFWDGLNEYAHSIQKIELAGGEPFMIKKQEILLKFLIERDLAKDIDISWFTNCTIWPEKLVKYFKHFRFVRIMLSLDNTEEQFEYIRYPGKWSETYEIFKKFKQMHDNREIHLGISHSIGLLNVWRLPEFHAWCREHEVAIFNNIVVEPAGVRDLPYEFKLEVKEKLEAQTDPSFQNNPIVGKDNWLVKFMMEDGLKNDIPNWYKTFVQPSRPELNLLETFPELKGIL